MLSSEESVPEHSPSRQRCQLHCRMCAPSTSLSCQLSVSAISSKRYVPDSCPSRPEHQLHCRTCAPSTSPSLWLSTPSNTKERHAALGRSPLLVRGVPPTRLQDDFPSGRSPGGAVSAVPAPHQNARTRSRARTPWAKERLVRTRRRSPLASSKGGWDGISAQLRALLRWRGQEGRLGPAAAVRRREC